MNKITVKITVEENDQIISTREFLVTSDSVNDLVSKYGLENTTQQCIDVMLDNFQFFIKNEWIRFLGLHE